MESSKTKAQIWLVDHHQQQLRSDHVVTEEPLEMRLVNPRRTVAVTMRTPGADFDLVAGFLYSEGMIQQAGDIQRLSYCVDPQVDGDQRQNIVNVEIRPGVIPNLPSLERHFFTTSACGVCGKASLDQLRLRGYTKPSSSLQVSSQLICQLPDHLRSAQKLFSSTGGLHAAALFNASGDLILLREDVGRHNALDKLIGSMFLTDQLPLTDHLLMVSGRASFELLQKTLTAGIPIFCAVSAPSSLAVQLAQEFGITLIGFLRGDRFNVYAGMERILTL